LVFVVDLDGPSSEEASTLGIAERLIGDWIWRSYKNHLLENQWQKIAIGEHELHVPTKFRYDQMDNGWHRISDANENKFYAFRIVKSELGKLEEEAAYWTDVARRNTRDFNLSNPYKVQYLNQEWLRIDFRYQSDELGEIWGAIMMLRSGEDTLVGWYESPKEVFNSFEEQQVMIGMADLVKEP
jgi:hypothetical protein